MYLCIYVFMYLCIYEFMYLCIYVFCIYVFCIYLLAILKLTKNICLIIWRCYYTKKRIAFIIYNKDLYSQISSKKRTIKKI